MLSISGIDQIMGRMASNVLNVVLQEHVKNPYLTAVLQPLAEIFTNGILTGLSPSQTDQAMSDYVKQSGIDLPADAMKGLTQGSIQYAP